MESKTYDELKEKLTEYFLSKVHTVAARYEFHKFVIKPNQIYREGVGDIRGIVRNFNFICFSSRCAKEYTDEMIHDMIILHSHRGLVCSVSAY